MSNRGPPRTCCTINITCWTYIYLRITLGPTCNFHLRTSTGPGVRVPEVRYNRLLLHGCQLRTFGAVVVIAIFVRNRRRIRIWRVGAYGSSAFGNTGDVIRLFGNRIAVDPKAGMRATYRYSCFICCACTPVDVSCFTWRTTPFGDNLSSPTYGVFKIQIINFDATCFTLVWGVCSVDEGKLSFPGCFNYCTPTIDAIFKF